MTNKTEEVLKHLKQHKSITSREAIELFGATRLSAIIFNLKKRGYDIICKREECIDRYGHTCLFGRYVYLGMAKKQEDILEDFFGKPIDHPFFHTMIFKRK